jgi:hypothetical protein
VLDPPLALPLELVLPPPGQALTAARVLVGVDVDDDFDDVIIVVVVVDAASVPGGERLSKKNRAAKSHRDGCRICIFRRDILLNRQR